jgi:DNA-binding XRE family transcriptional regulator
MTTLGERIKIIRGETSREKFAPLLGVSKNTIVNYETDARTPDTNFVVRLLELYPDTNPTWLLTGEGPRPFKGLAQKIAEGEPVARPKGLAQQMAEGEYDEGKPPGLAQQLSEEGAGQPRTAHAGFDDLGMAEGMGLLAKVYSSGDAVFIRAINANLAAFGEAIDNKATARNTTALTEEMNKRLVEMEKRLHHLEKENQAMRARMNSGDDGEIAAG